MQRTVICPPIVQEVLQGVNKPDVFKTLKLGLSALARVGDPVGLDFYLEAADIFRFGRRKGYTIRSSVDCLIAAIAIKHHLPIFHRDRDFDNIAKFTTLDLKSVL